jgi:HAD superfamily hydrolase (TIGR01509 family)
VIFDCGGVLVDSEAISDRVLAEMLSEQGLLTTPAGARKDYEGKRVADIVRIAERKLAESFPDGWEADFERRRGQAFIQDGLRAMPGAMDVIVGLRAAGIDVCVASQGRLAKIRFSLGLTKLLALFDEDALFSAESMRRGKPHPDLFQHVAQRRDASVLDTVVIEDTPSGIKAAVAAKMRPFGFAADTDPERLKRAGATETLRSLEELPELVGV